jgi:hypothetical protein
VSGSALAVQFTIGVEETLNRSHTVCMTPTTSAPRFLWSDLGRRSADVGHAIDDYGEAVVIRGTAELRLAPAPGPDIVDISRQLCAVLARLAELGDAETLRRVLHAAWAWTRPLPDDDLIELAHEAGHTAETCESVGTWGPLAELLTEWRYTARAWAEGARPVHVDEPEALPPLIPPG